MTVHRVEPAAFTGQEGEDPGDEVFIELARAPMVFCWCPRPARPFLMGSPESEADRGGDETPHYVLLSAGFWLAKHPCNQAQYEAVTGKNPSSFKNGGEWPVESVSWNDATAFCRQAPDKLAKGWQLRLPTEAQWEYASRAGGTFDEPFGIGDRRNLHSQVANHYADYPYGNGFKWLDRDETIQQGRLPPNDWGLHDMHGQVLEWCEDWMREYEKSTEAKPLFDPTGPSEGDERVLRGGAWDDGGRFCRSGQRIGDQPGLANSVIGFRPVLGPSGAVRNKRSGDDA